MPPVVGELICKDPRDKIDQSRAKLNLICVPQAGMGAWAFHGWQKHMPQQVDVMPVDLPGRNSRMLEPKPTSMPELVKGLVDGLVKYGAFKKPYVILGHSLGAWVVFETVAEVLRRGEPAPQLVIVSGTRAPHRSAIEHDADKISPKISHLSEAEFFTPFERRYGKNPDIEGPVKTMLYPLLKADFGIVENYTPTRTEPLPCPLVACTAVGDSRLAEGQLSEWKQYAPDEASFRQKSFMVRPLPWSTPHRYMLEDPKGIQQFLHEECAAILADPNFGKPKPKPSPSPTAMFSAAQIEQMKKKQSEQREANEPSPEVKSAAAVPDLSTVDITDAAPPPAAPAAASATPANPDGPLDEKIGAILDEANCAAYKGVLGGWTAAEWSALVDSGRPAFLKMLADAGVAKLAERQGIANKLGKAKREGRV